MSPLKRAERNGRVWTKELLLPGTDNFFHSPAGSVTFLVVFQPVVRIVMIPASLSISLASVTMRGDRFGISIQQFSFSECTEGDFLEYV
jgi:hypothetical protein